MSTPSKTPPRDGGGTTSTGSSQGTERARRIARHAWLIARTELRRRRRALGENRSQLVGVAIAGVLILPVIAVLVAGAYFLGGATGTDAFAEQFSLVRGVVAAVLGYAIFFAAIRTLQDQNSLEAPAMMLTTVPATEVAAGIALSEYVLVAGVAALPIAGVAIAFAVGAASPASLLVIPVVLFAVLALGVLGGYAIGLAAKNLGARYAVLARYKTVFGVVLMLVYFGLIATGALASVFGPVFAAIQATPLGWFADLALVAAPDATIGLARPAAAAATLLVGVPLVTWLAVRLGSGLWYIDPVQPDDGEGAASALGFGGSSAGGVGTRSDGGEGASLVSGASLATGVSDRVFAGRVPRSMLRIAQKSWRRAYRAPIKLQYAVIPAFFLITPIQQSIQAGQVSAFLPASVAIYGAWASGAAFSLNPLGDEGAVLPVTLTTPVSGRGLLAGLVFAGAAVGAPLTGVLALVLGVASPLSPIGAVGFAVLGVVLCVGAAAIAAGVGTRFPKFERTKITRSREAIVPSLSAFLVYSLGLLVVALPGLVAGVVPIAEWAGDAIGVPETVITLGGLAVTTALVAVVAWFAVRSAAATIDDYTM